MEPRPGMRVEETDLEVPTQRLAEGDATIELCIPFRHREEINYLSTKSYFGFSNLERLLDTRCNEQVAGINRVDFQCEIANTGWRFTYRNRIILDWRTNFFCILF